MTTIAWIVLTVLAFVIVVGAAHLLGKWMDAMERDRMGDAEVNALLKRMERENNERPRVRAGTSPKADRRDVRGTY